MKRTFEVLNVKCGGCANTLKKSLKDEFGDVEVDLEVEPRKITLDISDDKIANLREKLKKLGYPMSDEKLGKFDTFTTNAKSYVSCAIGKMDK
jgi:copper chaperone CopZ